MTHFDENTDLLGSAPVGAASGVAARAGGALRPARRPALEEPRPVVEGNRWIRLPRTVRLFSPERGERVRCFEYRRRAANGMVLGRREGVRYVEATGCCLEDLVCDTALKFSPVG